MPLLGGVGASDMIDIAELYRFKNLAKYFEEIKSHGSCNILFNKQAVKKKKILKIVKSST